MTRFIISADQAVDLVLKALTYSIGGEVVIPFIPAAKTIDIIEVLKSEMGADNEIVDIGIRPGEKIHESLINEFEIPLTYKYEDIFAITSLIETYLDVDPPVYKLEGEKLDNSTMSEYISKDHVVTQERLAEILREFDLI